MKVIPFEHTYWQPCTEIWNSIVKDGVAFPQTELLDRDTGIAFFESQSYTGVAVDESKLQQDLKQDLQQNIQQNMQQGLQAIDFTTESIVGLYILHPNNVGRCGHICNASYAVRKDRRGQHIGEALVRDCMEQARKLGFRVLQFNAVVATNEPALALYEKIGFTQLGVIPKGFLLKSGEYADIIPHYIEL